MKHVEAGRGGGQLLRTALSMAACTQQPVRIENIRVTRPKPGLQPQHLACVNALQKITDAQVQGAKIGATQLTFTPQTLKPGAYAFDIGTAGSAALLLQCVLPPLLFAEEKSSVAIHGGTDVPFAPPSFFMERVFPNLVNAFGARAAIRVKRHGFYPKGGGILEADITPVKELNATTFLQRPEPQASATILSAGLPSNVAEREKKVLQPYVPNASVVHADAKNPGNLVFLQRDAFNAFSALGKPGKKAEDVAQEALHAWQKFESGSDALEPHALDQMLLYAALAPGESRFSAARLSQHAQTNLDVLSVLLGTAHRFQDGLLAVKGAQHPQNA